MPKFNDIFRNYEEEKEDLKKELLCSLLEEIGFEGTDASLEESLFEYGLVSYKNNFIAHFNGNYETFDMCKGSIKDAIELMDGSFYNYLGTTKSEYLLLLDYDVNFHQIVSDIFGYDNTVLISDYFQYNMSLNDIISYLKSNYNK